MNIYMHTNVCLRDDDTPAIEATTRDSEEQPGNPYRHSVRIGDQLTIHLTNQSLHALAIALNTINGATA